MTNDNCQHTHIHRVADVAIEANCNQFLGWVNRRGCTASLNQEIPETPQKNDSTDYPKWNCEIGKNSCLNLWTSPQKNERNITCNHTRSYNQKQERFEGGHHLPPLIVYFNTGRCVSRPGDFSMLPGGENLV